MSKLLGTGYTYPKYHAGSDLCLNCHYLSILEKVNYIMKPSVFLHLKL